MKKAHPSRSTYTSVVNLSLESELILAIQPTNYDKLLNSKVIIVIAYNHRQRYIILASNPRNC